MSLRLSARFVAITALLLSAGPAAAEPVPPDTVDISAYKDKLAVLTDGKGHYVAVVPFSIGDSNDDRAFYGDGKAFYALRRMSGGRQGDAAFDSTFWEPRVERPYQASLGFKDKKYFVQCGERENEFKALEKADADKMIAGAQFFSPRWKRRAYSLARDNNGVYYYVDRAREPEGSKDFRVFRGPKGAVKELKMTNVVNDSEGDIFITKAGKLRLVMDKHETSWLQGGKTVKLIGLPVDDNRILIYSDLGAYVGQKLGTPCDDLL
jgi:hypothetical protein